MSKMSDDFEKLVNNMSDDEFLEKVNEIEELDVDSPTAEEYIEFLRQQKENNEHSNKK